MPANQTARRGEVYAFYVERVARYAALQIVAIHPAQRRATIVLLDWTGEEIPDIRALTDAPRLLNNVRYAVRPPDEHIWNVGLAVPDHYILLGTLPVLGRVARNAYCNWNFDDVIVRHHRWNSAPSSATHAFRASLDSQQTVSVPGLVERATDKPFEVKLGAPATHHFRDDGAYAMAGEFAVKSLSAWPALGNITLHSWRPDLIPFLETAPLVTELTLLHHGQADLDFSRTRLTKLTVDICGLERLKLPSSLDALSLTGSTYIELAVEAVGSGQWLDVQYSREVPPARGLERVCALGVNGISSLSVTDIIDRHPNVRHVQLIGLPGLLDAFEAFPRLAKLETLLLCDLFGFGPKDIPDLAAFPALRTLSLDSSPFDVTAQMRRLSKQFPHLALSLRRPRKPDWMEENLHNPLRLWTGREGISERTVSKACAAYRRAFKAIRHNDKHEAAIGAISAFLRSIQALGVKAELPRSPERNELIEAINILSTGLKSGTLAAIENLLGEAVVG